MPARAREESPGMACTHRAVDIDFIARTVVRDDGVLMDYIVEGIESFLSEIGEKRNVPRSDSETIAKALAMTVAVLRQEETAIE